MKRIALFLTAVLMMVLFEGLPAIIANQNDSSLFNDTAWILESLQGHSPGQDVQVTMTVVDGRLHGTDGCNRYSAPYASEGESFRLVGEIASTKMACPDQVMNQAAAFTGALTKTRMARIDGGQLVLLDDKGTPLAIFNPHIRDLPGTAWRVSGYNNGREAVVSLLPDTVLTMAFDAEGRLSGTAGCNRYKAVYASEGKRIDIDNIGATRMVCGRPEGMMEQEAAFLRALEKSTQVRIDGDRLELRSDDGALQIHAMRK